MTQVCHTRTIWQPEAEAPASHSIEGRLEQILEEELQKAGTATEAPRAETQAAEAPVVEAPVGEAPVAETPASGAVAPPAASPVEAARPAAEPAAAPAEPKPVAPERRERREIGGKKSSWIAGIVLLTAVIVFASTILMSLWRSNASSPSPSASSAPTAGIDDTVPPQAPGVFSSHVRDAATGRPVAGAQIYYAGQTLAADDSGAFQVQIKQDEPEVLVKAVGYRQTSSPVESKEPITLEPIDVRGFYLSHSHVADPFRRESILKLIRGTAANAVVLGVKDVTGSLNVAVDHPLARELGAANRAELVQMARQVAAWKAEGVYTIALLALFKDDLVARKKPALGLRSILSHQPIVDPDGIAWADPGAPEVRDYNIAVAKAAAEAGFDEIHFDFIRYPAEAPSDEGGSPVEYERRLKTLVGFLRGASEALAPYNVYVSASVFGSVCSIPRAGVIGQKIEDFAANVDYVAPMLYPSYFEPGQRYPDPLQQSYQLVLDNLARAASRLNGDSRKLRPWLQNFPDSASPDEAIAAGSIRNQVKAAEDAHASGWMLWDSRNRYRNTTEAITMLKGERGRAEAGRPGTVSGGALLPITPGGGEPPTANPGQQFRLLVVLLLAGCCLGILYAAVRTAWLFHAWSRGGPSMQQPNTSGPASGARALLRGSVSWAAFPKLNYDNPQFPGPLQRSAGRGRVSS